METAVMDQIMRQRDEINSHIRNEFARGGILQGEGVNITQLSNALHGGRKRGHS